MELFGLVPNDWNFLLQGLITTLWLSVAAYLAGLVIAFGYTNVQVFRRLHFLRWPLRIYVETVRSTPLLVQLLIVFFGLPALGVSPSPGITSVAVMSLYAGAYLSLIVWPAVESVPRPQWEAAMSLGVRRRYLLGLIVYPQALRVMLPSAAGFAVTLVKNTSLVSVVGFVDLTLAAQQINNRALIPFTIFGIAVLGYFLINFPISVWSQRLERTVRER